MEGLGWEGVDSSYLWSNVYQPYLNYSAAINSSPPPFSDNSAEYSTLIANNGVGQPSIIAPTTIWQQNNTVQTLGTDPVNDSRLQQHGGLNGVLSVKSSIDSLDCLLSTTNSNTDTSIDDEGGVISSPMSFWNFKSVSSKELEGSNNNGGDEKGKGKDGSRKRSRSRIDDVDTKEGSFKVISQPKSKRFHLAATTSSTISFQLSPTSSIDQAEPDQEAIAQMKELIYRAAALRPVNLAPEVVEKPKRKNVRTSSDPQTVAARQRRERISDRIRVLQRIVPGGTKMDTASMLDEAANYLKFLQTQIKALENLGPKFVDPSLPINTNCNLLSFSSIPFIHSLLGPMEGHIPFL